MSRIDDIAARLAAGWADRTSYRWLTGEMRPADLDEAYAVQRALIRLLIPTRGAVGGRKIALTSKAMQEMVGIDTPVTAAIFAGDIRRSPATVAAADFGHLGLEYELAFELGADAVPSAAPFTQESALRLVRAVRPAFELVDDANADYAAFCGLTLAADNAWCGGIVLGSEIDGWQALDLADMAATLHQDGMAPERANTGAADPVASLAWVLNNAAGAGQIVRAGEHIITGSVLRTRFPSPGDRLRYEIDGRAAVEVAIA